MSGLSVVSVPSEATSWRAPSRRRVSFRPKEALVEFREATPGATPDVSEDGSTGFPRSHDGAMAASQAAAPSSAPATLVYQRDRDHEGHGVSLRPIAEEHYQATWRSEYTSTRLSRSLAQLQVSFDRLLSDERRCAAYTNGIDAALANGARTFAVLGVGSLLPALHAARRGASVAIVEACEPLAQIARRAASDNGVERSLAVVSSCEKLWSAWGREPPDAILSERVDEGLLAEGLVPQLRRAVAALGGRPPAHLLPCRAAMSAVCVQLGFEGVEGFGLDGLGIDLRHFDSLRPHGAAAHQWPGYWPVRLQHARQPHKRLSAEFSAGELDFCQLCVGGGGSGGQSGSDWGGNRGSSGSTSGGDGGSGGLGSEPIDLTPLQLSSAPSSSAHASSGVPMPGSPQPAVDVEINPEVAAAAMAAMSGIPAVSSSFPSSPSTPSSSSLPTPFHLVQLVATSDGLLNAIVFWFNLSVYGGDSSAGLSVSSAPPELGARGGAPGGWSEGWRQAACYLSKPRYVSKGATLTVGVVITASMVRFELIDVRPPAADAPDAPATAACGCKAQGGEASTDREHSSAAQSTTTSASNAVPSPAAAPAATAASTSTTSTVPTINRKVVAPPTSLPKALHPLAAVPINAYHFCMMADTHRNAAYRAAIERAVARRREGGGGCRVLDIGAGTGLLGLIASRAGASRVDCVEMNDVLHVTARRTLAASSCASEHAVWHAISTELAIDPRGANGPTAKADLIVSEILDSGLIGEGVLHTMRDAAARLLAPGGQLLPMGASVYAMAIELREPETSQADVDLSALGQLRKGCFESSVRLHTVGHVKLSSPQLAFSFHFATPGPLDVDGKTPLDQEVRLSLPAVKRGTCNAILWWFDLHLDAETTLSAGPGAGVRTWKQNVSHIEPAVQVKKGDTIEALLWTARDNQIHVAAGRPGVRRPAALGSSEKLEPSFVIRDVSTWAK